MVGERTLPGQGLTGYWTAGSSGWKTGMDDNLRRLSALVNLTVSSRTATLPGSPTQGMLYIVPAADSTNPNKVALYDNSDWAYLVPKTGTRAFVVDEAKFYYWSSTAWVVEQVDVPDDAVPEAPIDGAIYSRKDGAWTSITPTVAVEEAPSDGTAYQRKNAAWFAAPAAVTSVTMGGDISGGSGSATVAKLQGIPVSTVDPTTNQVLKFDGTNWAPGADTSATSVTMTGDVTGSSGSNVVAALQGIPISTTDPASGEVLKFDGTNWAPGTDTSGSSDPAVGGDLSGTASAAVVVALQGIAVSTTDPASGEVLKFNGTSWAPGTDTSGSGGISDAPSDGSKYVRKDAAWVAETAAVTAVTMGGDVTGASGSAVVAALQGIPVSTTDPTSNQLLKFDGTNWTPATVSTGISDAASDGTAYERKDAAWVAAYAGYDVPIYIPDRPTTSMLCARVAAVRAYSLPSGLTGSVASAGTAATASTVFTIYKNTTSVGTITFASSGTTGTFSMASGQSFASGDVLRVIAPSTADTTLADISISFMGTRT